jgi:drug/metabolite transporter (DMT)-like permease
MALTCDKAGSVAGLNYIQVVMAFLFDVTIYGAQIKWTDLVGTACIIGFTLAGSIINALSKP